MTTLVFPFLLLLQDQNQGTKLRNYFPNSTRFPPAFRSTAAHPRSCECPFKCRCCSWATLRPSVPSAGNSAHYLRLPPTSQRPVPSTTVMSVVSGYLPAAHAFLHNKNALILLPSWPFKLSVPRGPQMATKGSILLLVSPQHGLRTIPGPGLRLVGVRWRDTQGFYIHFSLHVEETEAQKGQETHVRWWRWKWKPSFLTWHLVFSPHEPLCGGSDWDTWVGLHFTPLNTKLPLLLFLSLLVPISGGPHFSLCLISISLSVLSALVSSSLLTVSLPFPSFPPSFLSLFLFFPPPTPSPHKGQRTTFSYKLCVLHRLGRGHWTAPVEEAWGICPLPTLRLHSLTLFLNPDSLPIFF